MISPFGFTNYVIILLILSGLIAIFVEQKIYKKAKLKKEKKATRIMGWINICLGVSVFLTNWVNETWFW